MTATQRNRVRRLASCFGAHAPGQAVCRGHHAPLDFLTGWIYDRPSVSLVLGPRGGGKSFLASLATHADSIRYDNHGTRILGGSLAQSQQIYGALRDFDRAQPNAGLFASFTKTAATYATGSEVAILAASRTSVRGPHVPTLRLDEVDEIDPDIRESAMGMCMARNGTSASVSMTSTWHNVGGPMAALVERANAGDFPFWSFCSFEILERCPESRSGPGLENCPACPLVKWCHDSRDGVPRAKVSDGHYAIDALIQKVRTVSLRTFEADYLCLGPRADGLWFKAFDPSKHVAAAAEFEPRLPVHLAVDSGVFTGAVFFQLRPTASGHPGVSVFADYLSEGLTAEQNARALLRLAETHCNGRVDVSWTDPAGNARNGVGPTVLQEYRRVGLDLDPWPIRSVADGLALVEALVESADGRHRLEVHPRCSHLVNAFRGYRRAKRPKKSGQWMDWPEDPQHPHEDVMDALRGGLVGAVDLGDRVLSESAVTFPGRRF